MGQLVFILGRSGTGKSYSMRNFPKDKLAVINIQGKMLPFKGSSQIEQTPTDNSQKITMALDIYAQKYKSIVIDDYQYVMSNEFMRRSSERGYDKFTEIARHAWDIANKVRSLPDDVIVYIMCHTDRDDDGNEKIKTIGKLLDEKICLEGLSTIVLKTNVSDGQYTFLTQNNGKDTVKSPYGMFPTYAIDNDLWYVDQKIRNYYAMDGSASDEAVAVMDQQVQKPDVTKESATGRRRKTRDQAATASVPEQPAVTPAPEQKETKNGGEVADHTMYMYHPESSDYFIIKKGEAFDTGIFEECVELKREEWTAQQRTEKTAGQMTEPEQQEEAPAPKTRRRKARNGTEEKQQTAEAPAEEKKEETADQPKRRRRKNREPESIDQFMNLPEGDEEELPFV